MEVSPEHSGIPTVSRVTADTIIELVYDASAHKTALVVARDGQWSIESKLKIATGEVLVPYAPDNNLISRDCVLLASEPVESGSKEDLLADLQSFLHRYVDFSPLFERLAAHYVLMSWVFDAFNELPYLRIKGDFGTGKTRALIALGSIVYKGFFASAASTVSPIFHTLDRFGGTLILDEADLRYSDKTADLVKILNNGTVKGLPVLRTLQNTQKEFNPAAFSVYGPKIIAMRETFRDEALESRFITEEMGTRPLRADIPIRMPRSLKSEALALRNRLLHFRLTQLHAIKNDAVQPIAGIDPRLNQMAFSLLSLIDDNDLKDAFIAFLRTRNAEIAADRSQSLEARTLSALNILHEQAPGSFISMTEIAAQVNQDQFGEFVSVRDVGRVLRARSLPVYKSNGRVGLPKSALGIAAIPRKTNLARADALALSAMAEEGHPP